MLKRLFLLVFVFALLAGAGLWFAVGREYKGFESEAFVDIPNGTSTAGIATLLQQTGVIETDWQFLAARALQSRAKLQAGEYRFDRAMTPVDVFGKIARGDVFYYELRVPEGTNLFDLSSEVARLGFIKKEDFLRAARSPALVRDLAPAASSLEGYLFPSTYRITRRTTAQQVCRQMVDQFRKAWKQAGGSGKDVHKMVTLASLVEKETGLPEERARVASVYANRLRLGMKMDCDPTVIYAALLEGRYRGTIYRSDLDNPHPYNTYQHPGLPPGPIANPGVSSLRAALRPAETAYLFFVAKPDGSGGHVFSEGIGAHNAAVRAYRNGQAQ
ncbi:MAG: endolytic transglycosylase MltG [Bryobacteraceae bacterium]|nr:endolytic transglycosylase MltG [Bryobacteraceae bacterium]